MKERSGRWIEKLQLNIFTKRMELGDIENDTQQLAYETAIDFMEKYEELKHFLKWKSSRQKNE